MISQYQAAHVCVPIYLSTSTPQLPFEIPHIPTNRDHKALNRGTLGGLGIYLSFFICLANLSIHPYWPSHRRGKVDRRRGAFPGLQQKPVVLVASTGADVYLLSWVPRLPPSVLVTPPKFPLNKPVLAQISLTKGEPWGG